MKEENINLKVSNIAAMTGLRLGWDHNSYYGGYRLEERVESGGASTSLFGEQRRTYGQFIEFLDTLILGLVLKQRVNA